MMANIVALSSIFSHRYMCVCGFMQVCVHISDAHYRVTRTERIDEGQYGFFINNFQSVGCVLVHVRLYLQQSVKHSIELLEPIELMKANIVSLSIIFSLVCVPVHVCM